MGIIKTIEKTAYGEETEMERAKRKLHQPQSDDELLKKILNENKSNENQKNYLDEEEFLFSELTKQTNFLYMAEEFLKKQPLYFDKYKIWWIWNKLKYKWEMIDETDVLNAVDRVIKNPSTNTTIKHEILEALRRKSRLNSPKQPKNCWVQFGDKIYDIEDNSHFKASSKYFIRNPIPWKIGKTEETPTIDDFFIEWVGEEHKQELYEILAFCIVPCYFIHRLFCEIGSGANGKSTFLNLLINFIGEENVTSSSLYLLMRQRFEGSKLYGKLVCLMGETNFNLISNTDYLKKLTGQDLIRAEFKGKDGFDFRNYAKLIMATNSLPPTADKTEGFYRRWKINEWNNKFFQEKNVLKKIPKEEYNNLALKCLNLAKNLWKTRKFENEGDFEQRKKIYEEKSDPLMKFIKENYEKEINEKVVFSKFYEELNNYLEERGHRILSAIAISKQLKNHGFEIKTTTHQGINAKHILGIKEINFKPKNGVKKPKFSGNLAEVTHIT